jgi:hypothetical protein
MEFMYSYNRHSLFFQDKMHFGTKSVRKEWMESFNAAGLLISRNGSQKHQLNYFNTHENYIYKDKANTDLLKVYKPFLARKCTGYFSSLPFLA